jgi:hypothetical protein
MQLADSYMHNSYCQVQQTITDMEKSGASVVWLTDSHSDSAN